MTETNTDMEIEEEIPSLSDNQKKYEKIENHLTIPKDLYVKYNELTFDISQLDNLLKAFHSEEIKVKYYGLVGIRKLLSMIEREEIIKKVIEMKLISKLNNILDNYP